jgi:15-cis-phytoene desaturase
MHMNNRESGKSLEVVVVGAGLAGLATGALLAHRGAKVTLFERRPVLGGRALVVKQEGFTLNYGLHYIVGGYASPHYRILQQIGKLDAAPLAPVDSRKLFRMRGGQLYHVPSTPTDMLTTKLLSVGSKLALAKAFLPLMTADPETLWHIPVGEWLDDITSEPTLRSFLLDLCGPLSFEPEPELLSAAHFLLVVRPLLMPKGPLALYPVGGWIGMFEAFKACIEEHGGQVHLKSTVKRLEIQDGKLLGVWADGELVRADRVVLGLPPSELNDLLADTPITGLEPERLKSIRPTMGVAVDLGVMGLQNDRVATVELPELSGTLGIHNLFEPSLAPPGGHIIQFLRFLTPAQMANKPDVDNTETLILDTLEKVWPGIREKVVVRRTLIRPMLTAASHRHDQPRPTLLPIQVKSMPGLYLVGDATDSPGELSNSAGESALICSRLMMGE